MIVKTAIAQRFGEVGFAIPMSEMSADALQGLPPYVLIAWQFDYDMSVAVFAVPEVVPGFAANIPTNESSRRTRCTAAGTRKTNGTSPRLRVVGARQQQIL